MSSTCSSYSVASTSSGQEIDSDTSGSSDLDDLYKSFEFEDNATGMTTVAATACQSASSRKDPAALSGISRIALYPGSQIT